MATVPTIKYDLYKGTEVTTGYGDRRHDHITVMAHVSDLTGTYNAAANMRMAEDFAVSRAGTTGARWGDSSLTIISAHGERITDEKVWVRLDYGRPESAAPLLPGTQNVQEHTEYVWDYTSVGSSGYVYTAPVAYGGGTSMVYRYYYKAGWTAVTKFRLHTVLSTHPGTTPDLIAGAMNGDNYAIGGRLCPPKTVRYDNYECEPISLSGTTGTTPVVKYDVWYNLTFKSNKWVRLFIPTGIFTALPGTISVDLFGTAVFTGALPVHA